MLSHKEQRLVEKWVRISSQWACYPFDWNSSSKTLSVTNSRLKYTLALLHFAYKFICTGFLLYQLFPGHGYTPNIFHNFGQVEAVLHVFNLVVSLSNIGFQLGGFMYDVETVEFVNQFVNFNAKAGLAHFKLKYGPGGDVREKIFVITEKWMICTAFIYVLMFIAMPNNAYYMYSVLPSCWKNGCTFCIFIIEQSFFGASAIIFYLYAAYVIRLYVLTTTFWLQTTCEEFLLSPPGCNNPPKTLSKTIQTYRCLSLINIMYNQSFGSFALPIFKTALEANTILTTFGIIRMFGQVDLHVYIFLSAILISNGGDCRIIVNSMSGIHEISSRLRKNTRIFLSIMHESQVQESNHKRSLSGPRPKQVTAKSLLKQSEVRQLIQIEKRRILACLPLKCKFGSVYFLEKSTKIDLVGMLSDSVLSLLIMTK